MPRRSRRSFLRLAAALPIAAAAGSLPPSIARGEDLPAVAALIDGVLLAPDEAAEVNARLPVAVMVDNLSGAGAARPQYGLDRADLVYELLVEGGITRFMAVYLRGEAARIEPVRSVRTPFLYLVSELDAVLAHVGAAETEGPTDSRFQMEAWQIRHVEEIFNPAAFRRDRARAAPHNAVTSTIDVRAEAVDLGWDGPARVESWPFKDDGAVANALGDPAGHVAYGFALDLPAQDAFAADWYYDEETNSYRRWTGGRPHRDAVTGATLSARSLIVQFDHAEVVNHEGHVLYGSTGEGPAHVFVEGQAIEAIWTKPAREARTRYWDQNGDEVHFNRGTTWVSILPDDSPLAWE